jgi:hypothetical protein
VFSDFCSILYTVFCILKTQPRLNNKCENTKTSRGRKGLITVYEKQRVNMIVVNRKKENIPENTSLIVMDN